MDAEVGGDGFLQDIFEVGPLGTDTEVVKHDVALSELELGAVALLVQELLDVLEILVVATGSGLTLHRHKKGLTTVIGHDILHYIAI